MQDLKLDEKMVASKEAISRTWVSGSSKVRGAVGSALAGIDQYRSQRKPESSVGKGESLDKPVNSEPVVSENGKRESFVGELDCLGCGEEEMGFSEGGAR